MNWREIPIPNQQFLRALTGARQHPLDIYSEENKELEVNILEKGIRGKNYYARLDNPPYMHRAPGAIEELYVREGVYRRLVQVNDLLKNFDFELFVHDAYRPVEVQNYFHDDWVPSYLQKRNPDWSPERVATEVSNYWAKGFPNKKDMNPLSPPPHATGGVVDATLCIRNTDELVPMGGPFDEVSSVSFADYFESERYVRSLTEDESNAMAYRRILYQAMSAAGLVVNPNEWWHFGYGDQLSARNSGASNAVYGVLWLRGEEKG